MKTSTFSVTFELDPKHTIEFLTNFYFLKTFLNANQPEKLAELFDNEQDKNGFIQYGLPYVTYLKNLVNVVFSAKHHTTSQPSRTKRQRKGYKPVLTGKELSPNEIEHLERKIFGRRLLHPVQNDSAEQDFFAPWFVHDALYGSTLQFLENSHPITGALSSEDLEQLVNHIITCANEFRMVEREMDLLEYAFTGFGGKQNLQLPFPLSSHLALASAMQGSDHPSIRYPAMYKEWEYRVMAFIYGRTADRFGKKNLSEYHLRVIAGYIGVLIGIFKTEGQFEEKNTAGSWREYLAKNVKFHLSKSEKIIDNEPVESADSGQL